jgi:hypothetical protein
MNRKSQSALEFLTTYGWAFLVILIMIGALAYFGVLTPGNFLPDRCVATAGFNCGEFAFYERITGFSAGSGMLVIELENGLGMDIVLGGQLTASSKYINGSTDSKYFFIVDPTDISDYNLWTTTDPFALNPLTVPPFSPSSSVGSGKTIYLGLGVQDGVAANTNYIYNFVELPEGERIKITLNGTYVPAGKTIPKQFFIETFGEIQATD